MTNIPEVNKNELWMEMMKNMIHFTETSTTLINRMQNKLGVPNTISLVEDDKGSDPFQQIKRLQEMLEMSTSEPESSIVCKCTSSPIEDKSNSDEDISIGIEYYKPPTLMKKKKFKYPSNLETKILDQKKKRSLSCKCQGEGEDQHVDSCLCEDLSKNPDLRTSSRDYFRPIVQCSSLEQAEIMNLQCENIIKSEPSGDKMFSELEEDLNTPLASIVKPDFDPNKLPQDDSNPLILKGRDVSELREHILGTELFTAMKKFGSNIAQIDCETGQEETYEKFLEKSTFVAINLKNNLSHDDIVGLFTSNHMNNAVPYLAALFNGNRVVIFDRAMSQPEISACLQNVTPKLMFVSQNSLEHCKECMLAAQVDFRIVVFGDGGDHESFDSYLDGDSEQVDNFEVQTGDSPNSTAVLCFTSGTTGIPKAVCLSHQNLLGQCSRMIAAGYISSIILDFSEICKISSILFLFGSILNGGTRAVPGDFDAANTCALIDKHKIKSMYLHPHQCVELSSYLQRNEDVSSLNYIFTGGERLCDKVMKRLKEQRMGSLVCQILESTQLSGPVVLFNLFDPADLAMLYCNTQACGKPLDGVLYKIVDSESGNILNHSSTGELLVKSNTISNGFYVNNSEITHETEWFRTGDLAFYDSQGCFHFVDRISNLIKYRNTIVAPSKLEDILLSHPSVAMAVVIGVPHTGDEQLVTGIITLNEEDAATSEDLENFVNEQVSEDEKLRAGVKIIQSIPYNSNGKIKRHELLNLFTKNDL